MKMTNEEIKGDVKGIKAWEALKALQEGRCLQIYVGDGVRHDWQDYTTGSLDDDFANIPHFILHKLVPFRVKSEPINIEWTASFDIDKKTSVKHKISYKVDDLGKPIKDTIKVEKL